MTAASISAKHTAAPSSDEEEERAPKQANKQASPFSNHLNQVGM
jgi:hypothetical protein